MKLLVEIGVFVLLASIIILAMVAIVTNAAENDTVPQFSFREKGFNKETLIGIYMFFFGLSVIFIAILLIVICCISPKNSRLYTYIGVEFEMPFERFLPERM